MAGTGNVDLRIFYIRYAMTENMSIRNYTGNDLKAFTELFNVVNGLVGTNKARDAENIEWMLSQPSCNPQTNCFLSYSKDALTGFLLIVPELPISRIVATGGVSPLYRNHGLGTMFTNLAIKLATQLGASVLHVQAAQKGVTAQRMLNGLGFRSARHYLQMRWVESELVDIPLPSNYIIREFRLNQDESTLVRLQNITFGDHWGFCPNTIEDIHAKVRQNSSASPGILFVCDDSDEVAAYIWTTRNTNEAGSIGWISMTGVHPLYRGRGLGMAIVVAGLKYLKELGINRVELEVDFENIAARELYLKLGFIKTAETLWYEKLLTP